LVEGHTVNVLLRTQEPLPTCLGKFDPFKEDFPSVIFSVWLQNLSSCPPVHFLKGNMKPGMK
jgi:hypothetical protein